MIDSAVEDSSSLEAILLEASRLSDSGSVSQAVRLLLSAESDHPDDATLLCMIGVLSDHLGSAGMAADYFRRCLEQDPTDPQILVRAGAGLAPSGDAAAEAALRLAALTAPELALARRHYGAYLVRSGLLEQGLEELLAAHRLATGDPETALELGIGYLIAGRAREALLVLEEVAAADPFAQLIHGLTLIQEEELESAAEELYSVAEHFAQEVDIQGVLALLFASQGWEEEAWLALSRAEGASPPADPEVIRQIEETLELDEVAIRTLLLEELAPSALRDRVFQS